MCPVKNIARADFETLFHRKWSIPILAELKRQGGSKFVTLQNRLQAGPSALRQTLDFLVEKGVVCRNPGHGHPMRPEYLLTPEGLPVAGKCLDLIRAVDDHRLLRVILMKWSLPTLIALSEGKRRFSELRSSLKNITARALTQFLKEAQSAGVVERTIEGTYPPTATYRVSRNASPLIPLLRELGSR
jgi:DNA-binding HxlR family transcriptional regulator